jgi:O-antigen/teichoic acid export membrane protein
MTASSLKTRYAAKLSTNLVGLAVGMVIQVIIPRGLGPKAYGDFNFLTNFFSELMSFFSLNTSTGFYTKLSQRQNEFGLISFYFQFIWVSILALFVFVIGSQLTGISHFIWVDQNICYVYMAAAWSVLTWLSILVGQIADAYGLTVSTELVKIAQRCFGLVIILILFLLNQLNLVTFFLYHYAVLFLLILLFSWIIGRNEHSFFQSWHLGKERAKGYIKEFYEYSHPLFCFAVIGLIVGILDRWLLQVFAGSVQQGFFGLSYQIGAGCFLFTSAMTSLITREFSIAYSNNDLGEMSRLFRRYVPLLYSIAAFFGCFACVQAEKVTYILAGREFAGAALPVMIMALYPIHQTYGQLSSSVFFAAGQTKLYRNIGLLYMVLSVPMAYFLLAPTNKMGLNAGAVGLALKFVIVNFLVVNVQLFFNAKLLNLRFIKYFSHQIICVGFLIGVALLSKIVVGQIGALQDKVIIGFILSAIIYSVTVMVLAYFQPIIIGLKRDDAKVLVIAGLNKLTALKKRY